MVNTRMPERSPLIMSETGIAPQVEVILHKPVSGFTARFRH